MILNVFILPYPGLLYTCLELGLSYQSFVLLMVFPLDKLVSVMLQMQPGTLYLSEGESESKKAPLSLLHASHAHFS